MKKNFYNLIAVCMATIIFCCAEETKAQNWSITGNAGTLPGTNFIGTTDSKDFVFKTNNSEKGRVKSNGLWQFGASGNLAKIDSAGNLSFTGTAGYKVGGNKYAFQYSGNPNYGLFFNSTSTQYEFRNSSAAPVFYVNANNGNGVFTGKLGIGITVPTYAIDVTSNLARTINAINTATSVDNTGVFGSCNNTAWYGYGVQGYGGYAGVRGIATISGVGDRYGLVGNGANGASSNYGLYGYASGGLNAFGVYGTAANATTNWAGYFDDGNVYVKNILSVGTSATDYTTNISGNLARTLNAVNTQTNVDYYGVYGSCNSTANYGFGVVGYGGYAGVIGYSNISGTGNRFGTSGISANGTGTNYGIYGTAFGGVNAYGVYGSASGGSTTNYAGYFNGDVYCTGSYSSSDRKLKDDIKPMRNAMEMLNKLSPSSYTFKTSEYKYMNLPEGIHYGLIADEVQQVLPGAVKKTTLPAQYENNDEKNGKKLSDEVEFNAVNYSELIPVIIAAVKEQRQEIQTKVDTIKNLQSAMGNLQNENAEMKNELAEMKTQMLQFQNDLSQCCTNYQSSNVNGQSSIVNEQPKLEQNVPNPFMQNCYIKFYIPSNAKSAMIQVSDINGRMVKTFSNLSTGFGTVNISGGELAAGTYNYSLFIDGKLAGTKQMVLTKE